MRVFCRRLLVMQSSSKFNFLLQLTHNGLLYSWSVLSSPVFESLPTSSFPLLWGGGGLSGPPSSSEEQIDAFRAMDWDVQDTDVLLVV